MITHTQEMLNLHWNVSEILKFVDRHRHRFYLTRKNMLVCDRHDQRIFKERCSKTVKIVRLCVVLATGNANNAQQS